MNGTRSTKGLTWARTQAPSHGERGSALVLALISVTVVTTVGLAYLSLSATTSRRNAAEVEAQQAFYLAEAGLAEAFQAVRIGRTGQLGSAERPAVYGNGLLWVTARDTADDQVRLESTARVGSGRAVLAMNVEPIEQALGFFGDEQLVVESVLLVDGFNSGERPYTDEVLAHLGENPPEPDPHPQLAEATAYAEGFIATYGQDLFDAIARPGDFVTFFTFPMFREFRWEYLDEGGSLVTGTIARDDFYELEPWVDTLEEIFPDGWPGVDPETGELLSTRTTPELDLTVMDPSEVHTGGGGLLGSNGDVTFAGLASDPVEVWGDVVPGPEGTLVGGVDLAVTGDTDPRPAEVELPEVEIPSVPFEPATTHDGLLPMVVPPGMIGYEAIDVAADAELVLTGPSTVVIGALDLQGGAKLTLDTRDGPVNLYITDRMELAPGSLVETSGALPEELSIQVASRPDDGETDLRLEATSQFHGVIYAPDADVRIGSEFEVYGSVVARRLEIAPGARLHFDNARYAGSPIPTLVSWRVLELPGADRSRGPDPFEDLGLERDELPLLEDAHELDAVFLFIEYVDRDGNIATWSGDEADFDWTQVAEVISTERHAEREKESDASGEPVDTSGWNPFYSYDCWWEEPSMFVWGARKGASLLSMSDAYMPPEQLAQGILDLSPLSATEQSLLADEIASLPADVQAQIAAAQ